MAGDTVTGIIPACAGNTASECHQKTRAWDHPRMRGEHGVVHSRFVETLGSSPHARGTQQAVEEVLDLFGIIPACAGNTIESLIRESGCGDHPRMRGEHSQPEIPALCLLGSSPHARGTQELAQSAPTPTGIIPACAGNTVQTSIDKDRAKDHPRMRGEH